MRNTALLLAAFFITACPEPAGTDDAGSPDRALADAGTVDSTEGDAASSDSAAPDVSAPDSTRPDSAAPDITATDATIPDSATPDTTALDATTPDSAAPDITAADATTPDGAAPDITAADAASGDSATGDAARPDAGVATNIVVDHRSVALFDQIPSGYLTAARELTMLFSDRSVGQNINEALDCFAAASWASTPASCRRDYYDANWSWQTYNQQDRDDGIVPERILFDADPVTYDRSNWSFEMKAGSWSELTQDFVEVLAPAYVDSTDVLSYQFSYLNVDESSDIADPVSGFFADNAGDYDVHDLEAYIAQHPDKIFIFWTSSLARGIGSQAATDFNQQMRQYAAANDKILFDVADIQAHTDQGVPCYDNRDGVEYCSQTGQCENNPDDGVDYPAICQDYTTETNGGHLGSVSAGKILIAKAFWVLMAQIAGWQPPPP